ncbi:hypothetical protein [Segetibacter koreensis]|uniref:hypothetical protein n=1 Tax=Segetibacter koreensis TaxID=398037 RepID=UPI0003821D5A|nr:hypothetical protein [Segetibacter koreensis]
MLARATITYYKFKFKPIRLKDPETYKVYHQILSANPDVNLKFLIFAGKTFSEKNRYLPALADNYLTSKGATPNQKEYVVKLLTFIFLPFIIIMLMALIPSHDLNGDIGSFLGFCVIALFIGSISISITLKNFLSYLDEEQHFYDRMKQHIFLFDNIYDFLFYRGEEDSMPAYNWQAWEQSKAKDKD